MVERWESFHEGGHKIGGLWRLSEENDLFTRIGFSADGAIVCAESVITFTGDGRTWVSSTYREEPGGVHVNVVREEAGLGEDTIPTYGEHMLVLDMIATGDDRRHVTRLMDSEPNDAETVSLTWAGPARSDLPEGPGEARRLDVRAGARRVGSYWVVDDEIVKSDWGGAESYPGTADDVIDGLDPAVAAFLVDGFDPGFRDIRVADGAAATGFLAPWVLDGPDGDAG
ncbi:hypothetical protein GCM10023169_33580 [Georgenia halophila]|uniref:DUF4178 domain-containing protein n=1 Tax=Georgenia halophila TaxID=620889 RepID=A0ABP8LJK5_9MICO